MINNFISMELTYWTINLADHFVTKLIFFLFSLFFFHSELRNQGKQITK